MDPTQSCGPCDLAPPSKVRIVQRAAELDARLSRRATVENSVGFLRLVEDPARRSAGLGKTEALFLLEGETSTSSTRLTSVRFFWFESRRCVFSYRAFTYPSRRTGPRSFACRSLYLR